MLDQLSKNITRCGLSNSTLNYLRVSLITQSLRHSIWSRLHVSPVKLTPGLPAALCDTGAHAGAHVPPQDL